jgi:methionyl-tRNA formyltransferase
VKNIIFLGGKQIGIDCLEHIIQLHKEGVLHLQGVLSNSRIIKNNTKSVESIAVENNIPIFPNLESLPETDIIYSVQYNEILNQKHINKAKLALNLHMAPLPEYRGCNQFSFAIIDEATEFGATIHAINTKIDNGDIAFEKRFPIPSNCWVEELLQHTTDVSLELFKETILDILNNNITFVPQILLIEKRGTQLHFRNEIEDLKKIDIHWEKEKINKYVRATFMPGFEPPYYLEGNEKKYFTKESVDA